jgi:hypothetical protein
MLAAPDLQLKSQRSQSRFDELDLRRGLRENIMVATGGSKECLSDQFRVRCVRHVKRNQVGRQRTWPAPVHYAFRDKLGVGYDDGHVLVGDEGRRAGRDLCDFPNASRDLDAVSYPDRALKQQDEAAEEVARDVLQTEPEPHPDGADEHVQRREVDTGCLKDDEGAQTDDDVSKDGSDGFTYTDLEAAARQHMVDQPSRHASCDPEQRRHEGDDGQQPQRRERTPPDP